MLGRLLVVTGHRWLRKDTSDEPQLRPDQAVVHIEIIVAFVLRSQDSLCRSTDPQRYVDINIILESMILLLCFCWNTSTVNPSLFKTSFTLFIPGI